MLNGVLYNIDANTMVLGLLFVIFFAIINFALNRSLKDKGTAAIIAFCISLLATYGLNRTSLNFSGMFYKIGINEGIIYSVVPIIILIGLIFMIWKVKLGVTLMLTGMGLIILSFFAYKKVLLLIIGIVTIVVGIFFWIRKRRRDKRKGILKVNLLGKKKGNLSSSYGPKRKKRWILWLLFLISFALAFYGVLKGLNTLTLIAGALVLLFGIILFLSRHKKKGNLNPARTQTNQSQGPNPEEGKRRLIDAAKRFNSWAKSQPNPKFVGSWANFINWLKKANWGNSEADICQRLGISQGEFVRIFKKYGLV